jgi:WhiB family redox-sensing transcriptional regulator
VSTETSLGNEITNDDIVRLLRLPRDTSGADLSDETPTWQQSANCLGVDPDLFFPERGGSTEEAKEVCRGCVVQAECLDYAMQNDEKRGVWGGLSRRERIDLRRTSKSRRVGRTALR